jgi:quinol monooxygenase YgiN
MLIVAGRMYVAPAERDEWVAAHEDAVRRARAAPGCLDLSISADPIEADRINLFELWESPEHLQSWRAVANPPAKPQSLRGDVQMHHISSSGPPD